MEFLARLAALAPPPQGEGQAAEPPEERTPAECRRAMTWAQRLKRVFGIDIYTCLHCGGAVRIPASVEGPEAIGRILEHFDKRGTLPQAYCRQATRGPPARASVVLSPSLILGPHITWVPGANYLPRRPYAQEQVQ